MRKICTAAAGIVTCAASMLLVCGGTVQADNRAVTTDTSEVRGSSDGEIVPSAATQRWNGQARAAGLNAGQASRLQDRVDGYLKQMEIDAHQASQRDRRRRWQRQAHARPARHRHGTSAVDGSGATPGLRSRVSVYVGRWLLRS